MQESDDSWTDAKRKWKDEHPDATIKFHKQLYIDGHIDELPWATYHVERKNYIMKKDGEQVQKTSEHIVPDTDEEYIQHKEQNKSSI